jgi:hypothetical protein
MSALFVFALAGIFGQWWIVLAAPIVTAIFLLAPPVGIYRHDETPQLYATVHLAAINVTSASTATHIAIRLVLVNDGPAVAEDFRIRLMIPHRMVPLEARERLIASVWVGMMGRHWYVESTREATVVTFRAGRAGEGDAIRCPPASRQELAEVLLPVPRAGAPVSLDYQVSGGTVRAVLDTVIVRVSTQNDEGGE